MRKATLLSVAGVIAFGLAVPVMAQQGHSQAKSPRPENSAANAGDPNRRICVNEALTGSRMARRVCRTAREWQQEEGGLPDSR